MELQKKAEIPKYQPKKREERTQNIKRLLSSMLSNVFSLNHFSIYILLAT